MQSYFSNDRKQKEHLNVLLTDLIILVLTFERFAKINFDFLDVF